MNLSLNDVVDLYFPRGTNESSFDRLVLSSIFWYILIDWIQLLLLCSICFFPLDYPFELLGEINKLERGIRNHASDNIAWDNLY